MDIGKAFATNETAEQEGVWNDLGEGARILVARWMNPRHAKCVERLQRPYQGLLRRGKTIPDEDAKDIAVKSMAEAVLIGWQGVTDDATGEDVPYSREAAEEYLRTYRKFRELVAQLAMDDANYAAQLEEDAAGN